MQSLGDELSGFYDWLKKQTYHYKCLYESMKMLNYQNDAIEIGLRLWKEYEYIERKYKEIETPNKQIKQT